MARQLAETLEHDDKTPKEAVSSIHDAIYNGLALYLERETPEFYAAELGEAARCADKDPQTAIEMLAEKRNLREMDGLRSEEHTSELQSLMRISYAVFCLKKKTTRIINKPLQLHHNKKYQT